MTELDRIADADSEGVDAANGPSAPTPDGDHQLALKRSFDARVRPHIDLVDRLRALGLEQDLDLPCVVVVGDQSSGKSSILEVISGVGLPRGQGMCTRCPLEMQLKRSEGAWTSRITYQAADGQVVDQVLHSAKHVGASVLKAQKRMCGDRAVSGNRITLRVEGRDCPDLTLIDLPGIVRLNDDKSVVQEVRRMLQEHIQRPQSIILCVVPCNTDLETNEVLQLASEVDPQRRRTIGVLTKPDTTQSGEEGRVMAILRNERRQLTLGYYVVRCRNVKENEANTALKDALREEDKFFTNHPVFRDVPPRQRGSRSLAERLTECLVTHIKANLPELRIKADQMRQAARDKLDEMGDVPPTGEVEKRKFLMQRLDRMRICLTEALTDGFRVPGRVISSRNVTPDTDEDLVNTSYLWRQLFKWFASEVENLTNGHLNMLSGNLSVSRIQQKVVAYRSTELPRFPCYSVLEMLVRDHVKDYKQPADECLVETCEGVQSIIRFVCDSTLSANPDLRQYVEDRCFSVLEQRMKEARRMVAYEVDKELLVYSQDKTFLRALELAENAPKETEGRSGSDSDSVGSNGLFFQVAGRGQDDGEERHNARLMQQLIRVYLDVANRRIVDNVPNTIRLWLYRRFVEDFREEVREICFSDDALKVIREDEEASQRREQLTGAVKRLTACLEELRAGP